MSSADYDLWIQEEAGKVDNLIAFAIQFLTECEARKTWTRKWPLSMTCGYTAPGIGLLLQLFLHNGVSSPETLLESLKQPLDLTMEQFMFVVNETIGNLLDMMTTCPVTQIQLGIRGLIAAEQSKPLQEDIMESGHADVYKVGPHGSNLANGPNIISFSLRKPDCETFHHAVIYHIPVINACYIIDSWVDSQGRDCRPLSSRRHHAAEVYSAIDELNSDDITKERIIKILCTFFMGHHKSIDRMLEISQLRIMVNTINPLYIQQIYTECEKRSRQGVVTSSFGGKTRNKSKNKSKKRSKKYNRRSNRKHRIYRRTPVKNKKV